MGTGEGEKTVRGSSESRSLGRGRIREREVYALVHGVDIEDHVTP